MPKFPVKQTHVVEDDAARFSWRVRVYYEDTDAGGVVFYANYLKFFERARTEWLRQAGIEQGALTRADGVMFVVRSTALDYYAPAKLDDELKLTVVVEHLGRASVRFVQHAIRVNGEDAQLLAVGSIKVGCVNCADFRPVAIPERVLEQIQLIDSARPNARTRKNISDQPRYPHENQ